MTTTASIGALAVVVAFLWVILRGGK